jgi:8-hydroxy-5-deazaflavin:NADPH oxidoreductase
MWKFPDCRPSEVAGQNGGVPRVQEPTRGETILRILVHRRRISELMKIGILGSGSVGKTLGAGFLKHGHQVMLGTRNPQKPEVQQWLRENPAGSAGTFAQAAEFAEFVVLATLGSAAEEALSLAGPHNFAGKTVMDTTNPIAEAAPAGGILAYFTGPNESLGERIQSVLPQAHVVKAFNSVGAARMVNPEYQQGTPTMFFCGDDSGAKEAVRGIIQQLGWEPYNCGGIIASRAIEPLCILWCSRGFQHNKWDHAFKLLTA